MSEQSFRFTEGSSDKFWTIKLHGTSYSVHFGRVGTAGQVQTKDFNSASEAEQQFKKIIAEKTKKGYIPVADGGSLTTDPQALKNVSGGAPFANAQAMVEKVMSAAPAAPHAAPVPPFNPAPAPAVAVAELPQEGQAKPEKSRQKLEPHLRLTPVELLYAPWRRKEPLPKPAERVFDKEKAIQAACGFDFTDLSSWIVGFESQGITPWHWTKQEAHFWLDAMSTAEFLARQIPEKLPADYKGQFAEEIYKRDYSGNVGEAMLDEIIGRNKSYQAIRRHALFPAIRLFPALDVLRFLLQKMSSPQSRVIFRRFAAPYLSNDEFEQLGSWLRSNWKYRTFDGLMGSTYEERSIIYCGAVLGMQEELLPIIESIPDSKFEDWRAVQLVGNYDVLWILFGLRDPELVVHHFERLKLGAAFLYLLYNEASGEELVDSQTIAWIAHTEWRQLDMLAKQVKNSQNKQDAEHLLKLLSKVAAPETARIMLDCLSSSRAAGPARRFLDEFPELALEAIVDVGKGLDENLKRCARDFASIAKERDALAPELVERLKKMGVFDAPLQVEPTAESSPEWLTKTIKDNEKGRKAKTPDWLLNVILPRLVLDGWKVDRSQSLAVLGALQQSTPDKIHPLILEIRKHKEDFACDDFVWYVFQRWIAQGSPAKDKWAMLSIGMLGSESLVSSLIPMMLKWREENLTDRAKFGLECLRACGTDGALTKIHEISQNARLKSLNSKAIEVMHKIAADRGLTKDQLEDRIVPNGGLDENGTRVFDYGERRFEFVFGPDLKPLVRDENGQKKPDLPAPNQKDDPAKVQQAQSEWKELKKELKALAKMQAERLEQSMVTGRRWTLDEFDRILCRHPLMKNLIRLVVWAGFDGDGTLIKTFRLTEDEKLADASDHDTALEGVATVGIVHPYFLSDQQKQQWGEIFADYEIVPLFAQTGRQIYELEADETTSDCITRFKDISVPAPAIPGTLERCGWTRGPAGDGAYYYEHFKQFHSLMLTAVIRYEPGIMMMLMTESEPQQIGEIVFLKGIRKADSLYFKDRMPLSEVHPVVVSEVLKDALLVVSKAKA